MNSMQTTSINSSAKYPLDKYELDENGYPLQEAVDIHRLDLRFQETRIERPKALARLTQSIAEVGLRLPVQVADTGNTLILVDGYQRIRAFDALNRDRIPCEFCKAPLGAVLGEWFDHQHSRKLEAIEEAWLIDQLLHSGQDRRQIASDLGRSESWISHRLVLLDGLDIPYQDAMRKGILSSWAASRIFVPFARANRKDADQLLQSLHQSSFSTRELELWYSHYQNSHDEQRAHLLSHPRLFLDALKRQQEKCEVKELDPAQRWIRKMDGILRQLNGLEGQIEKVLSPLSPLDRDDAHFSKMGAKSREGERVLAAMACTIQAHLEL
ncbi:MAG: ParB N-terminal domain-containing protein [Gammaproteobacteria bacterium]|nr:ParB N-terminal domain-containing protein [Gammaproteobacteria bacterium]MBT3844251.1 ParB N-terminal domain-containing protein [Gammaproteobacteria bacterium]